MSENSTFSFHEDPLKPKPHTLPMQLDSYLTLLLQVYRVYYTVLDKIVLKYILRVVGIVQNLASDRIK